MMDKKIIEYRTKHKKCKWCKYYKWHNVWDCSWVTAYATCELKDKIINWDSLPRICKYYELKEMEKSAIQINKTDEPKI